MAKNSSPPPASSVSTSYEAALNELEQLVVAIESAQMPLDQLLQSYRRGADLLQFCRMQLDSVEQQVKVLEDGQLKPWLFS